MIPRVGLNVHPDEHFGAFLPLVLADDAVDAIEWSWELGAAPWLAPLLALFASHEALTTHLVQYPLSGDPARLETMLERARVECSIHRPSFVTAHYGVTAAEGYHAIAPVPPVPSRAAALEAATRLARLRDAMQCPVGVENLGIAFSADDVRRQAEMMHAIVGHDSEHFLLLDVHNLYCQAENFGLDPAAILALYPLERVREVHVSGGSWWQPPGSTARFRRDTHDDAIPAEVLALLGQALAHAPNVELVFFERMGPTLATSAARDEAREDYRRVVEVVRGARARVALEPTLPRPLPEHPARDARAFEAAFIEALCAADTPAAVRAEVARAHPDHGAWLEAIDERALHAAMTFERRWARPR